MAALYLLPLRLRHYKKIAFVEEKKEIMEQNLKKRNSNEDIANIRGIKIIYDEIKNTETKEEDGKKLLPRRMISISRTGMRIRTDSPVLIRTLGKQPSRDAIIITRTQRMDVPKVNLNKYGPPKMTTKDVQSTVHQVTRANFATNGRLSKNVTGRYKAYTNFQVKLPQLNTRYNFDGEFQDDGKSPKIHTGTGDNNIGSQKVNKLHEPFSGGKLPIQTNDDVTIMNKPKCKIKTQSRYEEKLTDEKKKKLPESENGSLNSREVPIMFGYNELGELVELKSAPRLCYGYGTYAQKDDELKDKLTTYRTDRIENETIMKPTQSYSKLNFDDGSVDTIENYINRIKNSPIKTLNYKFSHRDTSFTLTSSYWPWTINTNDVPTLSRYVWKRKLIKIKEYLMDNSKHAKINFVDSKMRTALHFAASWGCIDTINMLLKIEGIKVDEQDEHGKTPLYKAAEKGSFACVRRLLEAGADPTIRCMDGRDVLEQVIFNKGDCGLDLISHLHLKVRDRVEQEDYGLSLLHKAVFAPRKLRMEQVFRVLVKQGEDVNALDSRMRTPLFLATKHRREDMVNILVKCRADPKQPNDVGRVALDFAEPGTEIHSVLQHYINGTFNEVYFADEHVNDKRGCGRSCCNNRT